MAADYAQPRPLHLVGIMTHFYRGGPWELISRYRFAG